jgi:hypothetical protein
VLAKEYIAPNSLILRCPSSLILTLKDAYFGCPALNKFFKRNEVEYGFSHDGSEEFVMHTFLFFLIL